MRNMANITKEQAKKIVEASQYPRLIQHVLSDAQGHSRDNGAYLKAIVEDSSFMRVVHHLSNIQDAEKFLKDFRNESIDILNVLEKRLERATDKAWEVYRYAAVEIFNFLNNK